MYDPTSPSPAPIVEIGVALRDVSPRHYKDWTLRRLTADQYGAALGAVPVDHPMRCTASEIALRLRGCSIHLLLGHDGQGGARSVYRAWRCHHPLCPLCAPDRAEKARETYSAAIPAVLQEHGACLLELTFTISNVPWSELDAALDQLCAGYRRLLRLAPVAEVHLGSLRVVEVSAGRDGLAHPHLHVLMIVPGNYGSRRAGGAFVPKFTEVVGWRPVGRQRRQTEGDGRQVRDAPWQPVQPVTREGWVDLWRRAARLAYAPSVWPQLAERRRRGRNGKVQARTVEQAIGHALKYAMKPPAGGIGREADADADRPATLGITGEALAYLADALHGRRRIEPYGLLRAAIAEADENAGEGEGQPEEMPPPPPVIEHWRRDRGRRDYILRRIIRDARDDIDVRAHLIDEIPVGAYDPTGALIRERAAALAVEREAADKRAWAEIQQPGPVYDLHRQWWPRLWRVNPGGAELLAGYVSILSAQGATHSLEALARQADAMAVEEAEIFSVTEPREKARQDAESNRGESSERVRRVERAELMQVIGDLACRLTLQDRRYLQAQGMTIEDYACRIILRRRDAA